MQSKPNIKKTTYNFDGVRAGEMNQYAVNSMKHISSPTSNELNIMSVLLAIKSVLDLLKDVMLVSSRIVEGSLFQ